MIKQAMLNDIKSKAQLKLADEGNYFTQMLAKILSGRVPVESQTITRTPHAPDKIETQSYDESIGKLLPALNPVNIIREKL